jgi:hypothetical protein
VESNGSSKETRRKEGSTKETRRKEGSKEEITFSDYITFFEQLVMQVPVTVSDNYPFHKTMI